MSNNFFDQFRPTSKQVNEDMYMARVGYAYTRRKLFRQNIGKHLRENACTPEQLQQLLLLILENEDVLNFD